MHWGLIAILVVWFGPLAVVAVLAIPCLFSRRYRRFADKVVILRSETGPAKHLSEPPKDGQMRPEAIAQFSGENPGDHKQAAG
jgi:hypothetical protein